MVCLTIGKTALKNDNRNINIVSSPVPVVPTGDTTCTTTAVYTSRRAYYYDYRRRYRGVLSPRRGGIPSTLRDAAAEGLRVSFLLVERPAAHRVTARATRPRRTPPPQRRHLRPARRRKVKTRWVAFRKSWALSFYQLTRLFGGNSMVT